MKKFLPLLFLSLFFSGCGQNQELGQQPNYEETKKMVVDILKTDEGKKAITEIFTDEKMQQKLVIEQPVVRQSIEKTLTSDKGTDFLKKSFEDPRFAKTYAKGMQSEHEDLIKNLMKDPEYQDSMIDILKNPEMEKEITDVLKSKEYREHLQKVITETLESPLYKAEIQETLMKAAKEQGGKEGGKEGDKEGDKEGGGGGGSSA